MVDAIDLVFLVALAHRIVDLARRLVVASERLLENDAPVPGDQAVVLHPLGDRTEQARRGCEVGDTNPVIESIEQSAEATPAIVFERIRLGVMDSFAEGAPVLFLEFTRLEAATQRLLDFGQVFVASQGAATGRDDAALRGDLSVAVAVVQRRQQLAHRQVAGSAKNNQVERVDRQ